MSEFAKKRQRFQQVCGTGNTRASAANRFISRLRRPVFLARHRVTRLHPLEPMPRGVGREGLMYIVHRLGATVRLATCVVVRLTGTLDRERPQTALQEPT